MDKGVNSCKKCGSQVSPDDINSLGICYDCQISVEIPRNEEQLYSTCLISSNYPVELQISR